MNSPDFKNQDGFVAIFAALVILVLITIIGFSASRVANTEVTMSRNEIIYHRNFYMAEGAAIEAADQLDHIANLRTDMPEWVETVISELTVENVREYFKDPAIRNSLLFGALTVALTWSVAHRVLPRNGEDAWLAGAAAAVVAFNPQFLAVSATFSNDALVTALATASLALLLRIWDGRTDRPTVAGLCLAAGFAPLAKVSGLAVPAFALATLTGLALHRRDPSLLRRVALPLLAVTALVAGWWYVRNASLYGDPTGMSHMLPQSMRRDPNRARWLRGLPAEATGLWYSTWGIFGWFTVMLPTTLYRVISAACAAALVGLAGLVATARPCRPGPRPDVVRLVWLAAWAGLVVVGLLRWMTYAKGAHGRLLFPAVAFLGVALVAGWRAIVPPRVSDRVLAGVVGWLAMALALYALLAVVRPAYSAAPAIDETDVPHSAERAGIVFDSRLRLVAVEAPDRATEGLPFEMTMFWQALEPLSRDGFVAVRIDQPVRPEQTDGASAEWGLQPGTAQLAYPGAGSTPASLFERGRVYVDRRVVTAPSSALGPSGPALTVLGGAWVGPQPVEARLSVHLYDPSNGRGWPVTDGAAAESGDWSTRLILDPARREAGSPGWSDGVRLGDCIELAQTGVAHRDGAVPVWLEAVWITHCTVADDLTAFVHLVGADGEQLGVFDRPPATEAPYPTSAWRPGDRIASRFAIPAPAGGWNAGSALLVGLYRSDGTRLTASRPDGTRLAHDAWVVEVPPGD